MPSGVRRIENYLSLVSQRLSLRPNVNSQLVGFGGRVGIEITFSRVGRS